MKPRWYASVLAALCLAGLLTMAGGGSAGAQEPYVDLGVYRDYPTGANFDHLVVANYGTADAFGVRVVIEYGPDFYSHGISPDRWVGGVGSAPTGGSLTSAADNPGGLIWEIPRLPAKSEHRLGLLAPSHSDNRAGNFPNLPFVVVATVASDSVEAQSKLHNNRVEIWQTFSTQLGNQPFDLAPFSLGAMVNNQAPQTGENIVFDVVAYYDIFDTGDPLSDTVVQVQLTPGLMYTGLSAVIQKFDLDGNATPNQNFSTYSHNPDDNAGLWYIGPFTRGTFHLELMATLAVGADVNEQCLTAEISARPGEPLGDGIEHLRDNRVELCLGSQRTLISDGDIRLFTTHDCMDQTTYPCSSANDANNQLVLGYTDPATGFRPPGNVVIQLRDEERFRIADNNSVLWSTGYAESHGHGLEIIRPGIRIYEDSTRLASTDWGKEVGGFILGDHAISLMTGPPGGSVESAEIFNDVRYPAWSVDATNPWMQMTFTPEFDFLLFYEFSHLGTYVISYGVSAEHGGTLHSDAAIYTIHVGPVADLEALSARQTSEGLEITAVNNGPDPSQGARAEVNGQSCDFGGVFPPRDRLGTAGPLVTRTCLIPDVQLTPDQMAGRESVGTIDNHVDYTVCIDPTDASTIDAATESKCTTAGGDWHVGNVYDHDDSNNEIFMSQDPVPALSLQRAQDKNITNLVVRWQRLEDLFGSPVSYYEVQRLDDRPDAKWQRLGLVPQPEDAGANPEYEDSDQEQDRGDRPRYRVRAVNEEGLAGPWAEARGVGQPGVALHVDPNPVAEPADPDNPTDASIATVTATLTGPVASRDVTVVVSAAPASGSNPAEADDFTLSDNTRLTIAAGHRESTGEVTITAHADADGLDERISVTAQATNARCTTSTCSRTLTIDDDDAPDLVLSDPDGVTVVEDMTATYTVALNAQPSSNVHVRLYRGNNDITVDTDTGAGGVQDTLVFTPGNWDTPRTVTVGGVEDDDAAPETTTIRHSILDSPSAREYRSVADVTLAVTVTDNDTGRVGVKVEPQPPSLNVTEGQSGKTYRVSLGTQPSGNVYITTAIVPAEPGESGVRVSPATIVLNSNNWSPGRTVTVSAVRDLDGADEMGTTIAHAIDTERTTATEYVTWYEHPANDVDDVTVNVSDVDKPGVQVSPETLRINEGRSGTYNVRLNTQPAQDETVTITVRSDGPDVTVSPGKLTFTSTNWNRNQRVTVNAKTDVDAADDTTMLRHEMSSTDGDSAYNGPSDVTVTVTVSDPDRPGVTIGPLSPTPVKEANRWIEETEIVDQEERSAGRMRMTEAHPSFYTVRLDTKPTGNVVIDLDTPHQDKVTVYPTSLTFTPDRLSWTVTVHARDDADKDDEKATIFHKVNAAASADEYDSVTVRSLDVTVDDNDDPGVTLLVSGPLELSEGGTAEYQVVLDTQADGVIVIGVESSKPGKVKVEPEFLWFSGILLHHGRTWPDWDKPQTITVTALEDGDAADETVTLIHKVVDANAHGWDVPIGAKVGEVIVTVRDDD